ncbi:MAG TPA: molybdopterin oxidoreductase, partial [Casimicrobiaceae bacterium]
MKILGASLALAGGGCARAPLEKIVPYRDGPAQQTYGKPVYYASTISRDGYGTGVLVATQMGRPTKIEGNPHHPASLGATDVFAQAAVLELWDPDRSQTVRQGEAIGTWNGFVGALRVAMQRSGSNRGKGLRILTDTVTSPSLHAQIAALLMRLPEAHWHQWQPLNRDNAYAGTRLAFGVPFETIYRFERARVVLALDADFLDGMPGCVRYARDFSATRNADVAGNGRSRLYAIECTPTLTGAAADHRLPMRGAEIGAAARSIMSALHDSHPLRDAWLAAVVADLKDARGASIVVAGERQPPLVHAIAHAINQRLGNFGSTVVFSTPVIAEPADQLESIRDLVQAMRNGDVDALLITGSNPVYDAPVDLAFAQALERVAFKAHHGLYVDETAARCDWHVPATHPLESWGDVRAFDGTVSLQQPCIAPLYAGKSTPEILAAVAGDVAPNGRELLRSAWRNRTSGDVDSSFEDALRIGVVSGSAFGAQRPTLRGDLIASSADLPVAVDSLELVFAPDPRIADGRHANNAWLQELPKPLSQLAWENAALIAPSLAQRLGIENEDVVELRLGGRTVTAPAWAMPGVPETSMTLALGYGRSRAGAVGSGRGANAYALRTSDAPWLAQNLTIVATGARHPLACAQTHGRMEGRDIVRSYTAAQAAACTAEKCGTPGYRDARTLYDSPPTGPYAWAMSIDLSSCIGCGACTIACQAENNIPVVGKDEMMNGREMHWIRVDRYYDGPV